MPKEFNVAQNTHHNSAEQDTSLEPDERRYAQYIIPYLQENSSKRSRTPESLAREVVKELRQPRASRCSYMIFGSAGTGKSVYLTTLFAFIKERLVRSQREEPDFPHIPVLHSNLKNQILSSITFSQRVVLDGIRPDDCFQPMMFSIWTLSLLRLGQGQFKKGSSLSTLLIPIHELQDENRQREGTTTQVNRELQDAGFIPIWSCRTREFKRLRLDDLFEKAINPSSAVSVANIPYLDTRNLSNVCMLDENAETWSSEPAVKDLEITQNSWGQTSTSEENITFGPWFHWMARQGNHDESIVFLLQNFSPPQVSHRLTHQLIERMYDVFQNEKSGEPIDAGNFVEKQNNFVISDLVDHHAFLIFSFHIQQRLPHTGIIHPPHRGIPIRDSTKSRGREHHTSKLFGTEVPLKENITYEILETFGIFHNSLARKWKRQNFATAHSQNFWDMRHLKIFDRSSKMYQKGSGRPSINLGLEAIWRARTRTAESIRCTSERVFRFVGWPGRFDGLDAYLRHEINKPKHRQNVRGHWTEDIRANKQS